MAATYSNISDLSNTHQSPSDAIHFAIKALAKKSNQKIDPESYEYLEMYRDMPYALKATNIPGAYMLVNRNYTPIGSNEPPGGKWFNYDEFTNLHVHLTPAQLKRLVGADGSDVLFVDGIYPWHNQRAAKAYNKRMQTLLTYC